MSKNTSNSSSGIGILRALEILGALGILFIVLKSTNVINWSWWLVLLPLYMGIVYYLAIILVLLLIGLIKKLFNQ
jgi:hypothetical protein